MSDLYRPRLIDNEQNRPRRVAREAFRLLDDGNTPKVILAADKTWEISRLPHTVIVPKEKLDALRYGMVRAAMEAAIVEARMSGRKKPGFMDKLELKITKWEISRFIEELTEGRQE